MDEGFWIVFGIYQIGEIIRQYNEYTMSDISTSPEDKWYFKDRMKLSNLLLNKNNKLNNSLIGVIKNYYGKEFDGIGIDISKVKKTNYLSNMFKIMNSVLNLSALKNLLDGTVNDISNITKLISFVNVKSHIKVDPDPKKPKPSEFEIKNMCNANRNTLIFAEKLLRITTDENGIPLDHEFKFSRTVRRRRSHKQKIRRSLRKIRRSLRKLKNRLSRKKV